MNFQVCAVRDRAVDAFMQPFFVVALGQAIRSFTDEVNRPESPMAAHPDDYDLFHIGSYDDATAVLTTIPPHQLAIGKDVFSTDRQEGGIPRREGAAGGR